VNQPANTDQQMMRLVAQWARAKGIKKPTTADGMRVLMAEFMSEFYARAEQVVGAAGDTTYNSDPISAMNRPLQIVRDSGGLIDVTEPETEDDEFTQLVRDRNRALDEAGGDDLAAEVIHRDGKHAALNAQAAFTRNNPPSALHGNLGSQATPQPGKDPIEVARWTGNSDAETTPVTCTFGIVTKLLAGTPFGPAIQPIRPAGVVGFGTSAFLQTFEIDIGLGCQFTLSGSQVSLAVKLDSTPNPANTPPQTTLAAMLSFQVVTRTPRLTRSVYIDNLAAGATSTRTLIPLFGKTLQVLRYDISLGTAGAEPAFELTFLDSGGTLIYNVAVAAGPMTEIFVPPDAQTFYIKNTAANIVTYRAMYGLTI
jgi:hypothetical protein